MTQDTYKPVGLDLEAVALGYTKRVAIEGDCQGGEFLVKPDADLDGRFKAWGIDWCEWTIVNGCNVLIDTLETA